MTYTLGIDTSCDDTSMAILKGDHVLSNVVSSQIKIHAEFGGIVPEVASRAHMQNLSLVFKKALEEAQLTQNQISAIAVTRTPGLIGCLLVGTSFAKALAYRLKVPLYGVNHLEGHLFSPFIGRPVEFPVLGLVVSGGHTAFYKIESFDQVSILGQTVDDAAGEAFDKVAKMLGLDYPGGPIVDRLAQKGDDQRFSFKVAQVKMGPQYLSFSGLKTAAYKHIQSHGDFSEKDRHDFCASLQHIIVESLIQKAQYFLKEPFKAIAVSGGVAMNSLLRKRCQDLADRLKMPLYLAKPEFCTDNGAMIAYAAQVKVHPDQVFSLSTEATKKIQARQLKHEKTSAPKR